MSWCLVGSEMCIRDRLRMLDTTRAIPNTTLDPNLPRVE
jgi:hypothetical protein